jgi:hypothetical protein
MMKRHVWQRYKSSRPGSPLPAMGSAVLLASNGGEDRKKFPGAKGGAGVWQRIISQIPPHELYVEAFAGTAQILLRKRPARASIAIDGDAAVCAGLESIAAYLNETYDGTVHHRHLRRCAFLAGKEPREVHRPHGYLLRSPVPWERTARRTARLLPA